MSEYNYENKTTWFSLDLEMNKSSETDDISDVIQIGATAFNVQTGAVIDKLRVYIKSENNIPVDPFIEKLTGITDNDLNFKGVSLYLGYLTLLDFIERNDCFKKSICWGGNDAEYLKKDIERRCGIDFSKTEFGFGIASGCVDVKGLFQTYAVLNNIKTQSGMAKSMQKVGLNFQGRIHDALDDSFNCVRIFTFLNRMLLKK